MLRIVRWRALMVLVVLLPALIACGGGDDDNQDAAPTSASTATSATTHPETPASTASADATEVTPEVTPATDTTPTQPPAATTPVTPSTDGDSMAYGFNVAWRGDDAAEAFNQQTVELVQSAGFDWVRIQIYWDEVQRERDWWDPLPIDNLVERYASAGINILATVSRAPEWAEDPSGSQLIADYADWEQFMFFMADRYKGRIQAWEIWNEQNHAITVRENVRVEDYVELLRSGSAGIRAADPEALVVFGGLTPTGVNDPTVAIDDVAYLEAIYQYNQGEIANYFDVLGAHANATHNPPDTMWPDNPGTETGWNDHESFFFRRVEQLREVMVAVGDSAKPIWITEFGWTTENQAPGYEYGVNNTEEEQATFLVEAFEIARNEWDWCTGMFVWNLNYSLISGPEDEKTPWAVLNEDGTPRPAYDALAAMPKE